MSRAQMIVVLVAVAFVTMGAQCADSGVRCGYGTIVVNGLCVPEPASAIWCDPGTVFDAETSSCVAASTPTECGYGGVADDSGGTVVCSCPGLSDCQVPLPCPAAADMRVTVCGQLVDAETRQPVRAAAPTGMPCDPANPTADGPCSLRLRAYDAVDLATNGAMGIPLGAVDTLVDDCGRFRLRDVEYPASADFVGITADDVGAPDNVVLSGLIREIAPARGYPDNTIMVVRHTTDQAWTTNAGNPFGSATFSERGALLARYVYDSTPTSGVSATSAGLIVPANRAFYFADTDSSQATTVDPNLTQTGANGSALLVDSGLVMHSGSGGLPGECDWASNLAVSVPGLILSHDFVGLCP